MPWDDTARLEHSRNTGRYPSDMTDREWALIAPLLPAPRRGGRPRSVDLREVTDAIQHIGATGRQWRALPKDFPPMTTVQGYFHLWRDSGVFETMNALLVRSAQELEEREASPTAAIIDSQTVKTTESGGIRGFGERRPRPQWGRVSALNGKKINGRKRVRRFTRTHGVQRLALTDTLGLLLLIVVHAADIQDRDGAPDLFKAARHRFPWMRHVFADGGYAGDKLREAIKGYGDWTVEIIKRSDTAKGFEAPPRRWAVERTFAWLGRCRRLAKDWERTIESSTAWALLASIRLTTRRLTRYCYLS